MSLSVAVIGECMLELTHADMKSFNITLPMNMNYGGDTINTAIYLSRNNVDVSYITGLGDDIMSDWLLGDWSKEGIDCSLVTRMPNSVPGMYMINVDDEGERSFLYWRKDSPASRLFDDSDAANTIFQSIANHSHLYLSGISLAILPTESCNRLLNLLADYRQHGGKLIFDGNYRPSLWPNVTEAQSVYAQMYQISDFALPTLEDEQQLFGYNSAEEIVQAIRDHGVPEIVVKMGENGCLAYENNTTEYIAAEHINPVDTTAAGDSFNAGYLANRLNGTSVIDACKQGHKLAGKVIQHRGAIIR